MRVDRRCDDVPRRARSGHPAAGSGEHCPGAFPSNVVASTPPSPVTTSAAPAARASKPVRSRTSSAPGMSSAAERRERGAQPAAGPSPRQVRNGISSVIAVSRRSSSATAARPRLSAARTPARPRACRAGGSSRRTQRGSRRRRGAADALQHAGPAVDGRRSADADKERRGPAPRAASNRSPSPVGGRPQRISLGARHERQPDGLRRVDHRDAVGQDEPRASTGLPIGPLHDGGVPGTSERGGENLRRSLSAVGNGRLDGLDAVDPAQPSARKAAASSGVRTPLRLAGDASASTSGSSSPSPSSSLAALRQWP